MSASKTELIELAEHLAAKFADRLAEQLGATQRIAEEAARTRAAEQNPVTDKLIAEQRENNRARLLREQRMVRGSWRMADESHEIPDEAWVPATFDVQRKNPESPWLLTSATPVDNLEAVKILIRRQIEPVVGPLCADAEREGNLPRVAEIRARAESPNGLPMMSQGGVQAMTFDNWHLPALRRCIGKPISDLLARRELRFDDEHALDDEARTAAQ